MKICVECGAEFTEDQSSGEHCFKCKLNSVSFNWVGGGGYGREAFHAMTNKEKQAEVLGDNVVGRDVVPAGRQVLV